MGDNKIESLERLAALLEKKAITPEEYAQEKARVLAEDPSSPPPPPKVDGVSLKRRIGGPLVLLLVGGLLGLWVAGGPTALACYAGSVGACSEASSRAYEDSKSRDVPYEEGAYEKRRKAERDEVVRAESSAALGLRFEERACKLGSEDDCGWQRLRAECRNKGHGTACLTLMISDRD